MAEEVRLFPLCSPVHGSHGNQMMLESEAQINTFRQTEGIIKGSHR
jgi:hypothetical protein